MANTPPLSAAAATPMVLEAWMPYRRIFDVVWSGRRHVMMMASQVDRYGNQNLSCIGDWAKPKAQLIGVRGAPGNTVNHPTSYWVPSHSPRSFVEHVDMVCGVGYDRAAAAGPAATRFHDVRVVVSNLGVFDFDTPDHAMRFRSLHPGVSLDEVRGRHRLRARRPRRRPDARACRPPRSSTSCATVLDPRRPRDARDRLIGDRRERRDRPEPHPALRTRLCEPRRRPLPDRADRDGLGRRSRGWWRPRPRPGPSASWPRPR